MLKLWKIFGLFFTLLLNDAFTDIPENKSNSEQSEYEYLDQLALQAGTDKSSAFHNYTKVYADYFGPIKNKPIVFMEIGIYKGNSVKLWESYFPKADLHFIDNTPAFIEYNSTRSHYHIIDQTNWYGLHALVKTIEGEFDIILDDAGHTMVGQIGTFQTLFQYLKSGGIYIIEDLHTSYWQHFGGNGSVAHPKAGPGTCIYYLQALVDDLNYTSARTECADEEKVPVHIRQTLNYYQDQIESIHFYKSLCIIRKK